MQAATAAYLLFLARATNYRLHTREDSLFLDKSHDACVISGTSATAGLSCFISLHINELLLFDE